MSLDDPDFKMMAPLTVSETEMVSGIPDAENQVYDAGTTYAEDALVWYDGNIWRSLQDANSANTPTEGAWWTDLGTVDEGAAEYDAGTSYDEADYVVYGGAVWVSAIAGTGTNTGNTPSEAGTSWTRIGATNRFKAFDSFLQDAASLEGGITYVLQFTDLVTDIAILRAVGTSVTIVMTDSVEGEVFNETFSLIDDSAITDWWQYWFAPVVQISSVLAELPPYAGAEIAITINGENVSVGQIVCGAGLALGAVRVGTGVGIESYSRKDRDEFNRSIVVARPYSDTVDFDLYISTVMTGYVHSQLAAREAQKTLFFMRDGAPYAAIVYGFFQNFDILHGTPVISDCLLQVEGLG